MSTIPALLIAYRPNYNLGESDYLMSTIPALLTVYRPNYSLGESDYLMSAIPALLIVFGPIKKKICRLEEQFFPLFYESLTILRAFEFSLDF